MSYVRVSPPVSREYREHALVVQESVQADIVTSSVQEALGEHSDAIRFVMDHTDVPTIQGDTVYPNIDDAGAVPIMALSQDESVILHGSFGAFTPTQATALKSQAEKWRTELKTPLDADDFLELVSEGLFEKGAGAWGKPVGSPLPRYGNVDGIRDIVNLSDARRAHWGVSHETFIFIGRPVINISRAASIVPYESRIILLHEAAHAGRILQRPFRPFEPVISERARLEEELFARFIGAQYITALGFDQIYPNSRVVTEHTTVEAIRRKHCDGDNPFYPTQGIRESLQRQGILTKYLRHEPIISER